MQPPRRTRVQRNAGMTPIEIAVLVCVIGVALAVFVPTFVRNMRTSKVAEASEVLAQMHAGAAAYYGKVHRVGQGPALTECLPPAVGPIPQTPSEEPVEVDFIASTTPGHTTFAALGFKPERPLRYRYSFLPSTSGCSLGTTAVRNHTQVLVRFRAEGDLDGDGELSIFERTSVAKPNGVLQPIGVLEVSNRVD